MSPYAQTNIQLFNQLRSVGYSNAELGVIHVAYELSIRLYTGYFIGSGRTQIAHVVGTASILGSLRVPAEVVAAALIHNVYDTGDFGYKHRGVSRSKRREIKKAVGERVEGYAYRFRQARLSPQGISHIQDDPIDRHVLLIEFAERLDHHLNDGFVEGYRHYINRHGSFMAEAAEKLGYSPLAAELQRVVNEPLPDRVLVEVVSKINQNRSRVIAPRSYRRRLGVLFFQELTRGVPKMCSSIRVKKLARWLRRLLLSH